MTATPDLTARDALGALYSIDATGIEQMDWQPVTGCPGVTDKILWQLGDFVQALVHYAPGSGSQGRAHLAAHHHLWVVSGTAKVAGRQLAPGAYMHVPPGVDHPVTDVGPEGFTLLHMHRPHAPVEAEALVARG